MTPLERLRIEKAAADCGFEMTPEPIGVALRLRSARFPEWVDVEPLTGTTFRVTAPQSLRQGNGSADSSNEMGLSDLYGVLRVAAARARTMPNRVADQFRERTALLPRSTEAERLVVERVGQDVFRGALLDYWQGECCVTGLDVPELLRASHIKPWAQCDSDDERLDVFNGLLLAPHVDALFDRGWISFALDGGVVLSPWLTSSARSSLGVRTDWRVVGLTASHTPYLVHHNLQRLRSQ
jgi:putative restriction endonuclease